MCGEFILLHYRYCATYIRKILQWSQQLVVVYSQEKEEMDGTIGIVCGYE